MARLTQKELSESDVTLEMTHAQFDALPKEIYEHLRLYIGKDDGKRITYRIPVYLYRELSQMAVTK